MFTYFEQTGEQITVAAAERGVLHPNQPLIEA
jgi:hypothetical protein